MVPESHGLDSRVTVCPGEALLPRLPDLVIVGAPKCATTAVARWLAAPEDTFLPERKELRFLDEHWDRGLPWYLSHFDEARPDQVWMEATPAYLAHPEAPDRAKAIGLRRFAVILRDPIDRAWSHYWFRRIYQPARSDHARPFATIVAEEIAAGCPEGGILTHGRYAHHLARWEQVAGREAILGIDYRQVNDQPDEAFHRIRDFAGLPRVRPPSNIGTSHNTGYRLRWPALRAVMLRHRLFQRLPGDIGLRLDHLNRAPIPTRELGAATRARLEELYAPDIEMIASYLDPIVQDRES